MYYDCITFDVFCRDSVRSSVRCVDRALPRPTCPTGVDQGPGGANERIVEDVDPGIGRVEAHTCRGDRVKQPLVVSSWVFCARSSVCVCAVALCVRCGS